MSRAETDPPVSEHSISRTSCTRRAFAERALFRIDVLEYAMHVNHVAVLQVIPAPASRAVWRRLQPE